MIDGPERPDIWMMRAPVDVVEGWKAGSLSVCAPPTPTAQPSPTLL